MITSYTTIPVGTNLLNIVERPMDHYINRIWLSVKDKDYKTIPVCSKPEFKSNILKELK